MDLFEMEIALIDGLTLTYIDYEDGSRCSIKYDYADTVRHIRETISEDIVTYADMPALLVSLTENDTDVTILQSQL